MANKTEFVIDGSQKSVSTYVAEYYRQQNKQLKTTFAACGVKTAVFLAGSFTVAKLLEKHLLKGAIKAGLGAVKTTLVATGAGAVVAIACEAADWMIQCILDARDEANYMCLDAKVIGSMSTFVPDEDADRVISVMSDIGDRYDVKALKRGRCASFSQYCTQVAGADGDILQLLNLLSNGTIPIKGIFSKRVDFDAIEHTPLPRPNEMINSVSVRVPYGRDFSNLAAFVSYLCGNLGYIDFIGRFDAYGFYDNSLGGPDLALLGFECVGMQAIHRSLVNPVSVINTVPTLLVLYLSGCGVVPANLDFEGSLAILDINSLRKVYVNDSQYNSVSLPVIGPIFNRFYDAPLKKVESVYIPLAQTNYITKQQEIGTGGDKDMIDLCNYKLIVDDYRAAYSDLRRKYGI